MYDPPPLSNRALKRIESPPLFEYAPPDGPFYDAELHPEGAINLSIAENSLLTGRLLEHLSRPLTTLRTEHLKYRPALLKSELPTVEDLLPEYINDHFHPRVKITRENSMSGPGLSAVLAQLVWTLAGEGDGVLMSAPFYSGYIYSIVHPSLAVLVLAHVPQDVDPLSVAVLPYLEAKVLSSAQMGVHIKALLITNPHNPLPRVAPQDVIVGYARLAQKYNIHLIVDEVYALSTFASAYPPEVDEKFTSALTYDFPALGVDPARVHVLASPTKDFGASGLKLGLLISPSNPPLLDLMRSLFQKTPIGSASDALFARVLEDKPFVAQFLKDNRAALAEAYELVVRWMMWHRLEFTHANAGVYVVVDFAPFLARLPRAPSAVAALDAGVAAMCKAGVFIKPTNIMADPVPTRFRLVFVQPRATMELALRRIEKAFGVGEAPFSLAVNGLEQTHPNGNTKGLRENGMAPQSSA
ncbi:PLP-dependent transferase [Mycena latifolia]|nr:PLP-dependent transferase [Mycena latifolia]